MYTYLVWFTCDYFELPLGIFDTLVDVADFIGCTPQWLSSMFRNSNVNNRAIIKGYTIERFLTKKLLSEC